jgi:hypothetical protein
MRLNDLMTKQTIELQPNGSSSIVDEEKVMRELVSLVRLSLQTQIPEALSLRPVLLNTYHRRYFYSQYYDIRLTLDDQLRFHPITALPVNKSWRSIPGRIIEAKYAVSKDVHMAEIMKFLPLTLTKSSKYIMGMQLTAAAIG